MNVTDLGVLLEWRVLAVVIAGAMMVGLMWLALFVGARIGAGRDDF